MKNQLPRFLALLATLLCLTVADVASAGGLIPDHMARGYGLQRAWFSQVQLNPAQHRVERAVVEGDQLFVLTTAGLLHAIDAETGATDWVVTVGNPDYPSLGPAVSAKNVAVVNGSSAYVIDRSNGRVTYSHQLTGGAAAGPALTNNHVYVPLFSGRVEGFNYRQEEQLEWVYASTGKIYTPLLVSASNLMWSTDRGYLYFADAAATGVRFRFEATSPIVAAPTSLDGYAYVASTAGYVYSINETSGNEKWKYATGAGVIRSPFAIGERVYVATERPSLFALDAVGGKPLWEADNVAKVVAAGKSRVYGLDRLGQLLVLDAETGALQGRIRTSTNMVPVLNEQTDRLYLIDDRGLVQCLHEVGADEPTFYRPRLAPLDDESLSPETGDNPPGDNEQLGGPGQQPPQDIPAVNPNPEPAGNPFDDIPAGDNPFGGVDGGNPFEF